MIYDHLLILLILSLLSYCITVSTGNWVLVDMAPASVKLPLLLSETVPGKRRVRHSNTIRHHITVYVKMEYTPKTMATSIGECDGKSANSMQSMYNVIRSSGHPKAGGFPHFLQRSNDTKGLSKPLGTPAPPWSCTKNSSDLQDLSGKDQRMSTTTRRILTSL